MTVMEIPMTDDDAESDEVTRMRDSDEMTKMRCGRLGYEKPANANVAKKRPNGDAKTHQFQEGKVSYTSRNRSCLTNPFSRSCLTRVLSNNLLVGRRVKTIIFRRSGPMILDSSISLHILEIYIFSRTRPQKESFQC
ncbi:uncharacterized protein LOC141611172 [Silene latifolia]|uniref:uncharacterized protein LOC141611172 n=1 Tax=Silene latifolia TaxID=37657 RepID=UPI003D77D1A3